MNKEFLKRIAWFRIVSLIVVALVIIGVGYWLIASSSKKPKTITESTCTSKSSSKKCLPTVATTAPVLSSPRSNSKNNNLKTTTPTVAGSSKSQLVNTGPGDVISVFVSVTFVSGIFHYFYRKNKSVVRL